MPQLNYLSNSPWEALTNSAMNVGHSLSGLAGLQLRKQQLEMQQQMSQRKMLQDAMLEGAHASLYRAQSEGEKEKTRASMEQSQRSGMLGDYVRSMYDTDESQHPMTYNMLRGGAAGTAASIGAGSPATVARTLATLEQNRDPETQRRFVLGGRPEVNVPMGSTLVDPRRPMSPLFEANVNLAPGHVIRGNEPGQMGLPQQRTSGTSISPNTALSLLGNETAMDNLSGRLGPSIVDILAKAATNSPSSMLSAPTQGPVRVSTKQEYDSLPPGTQYVGPDGKLATKR